MSIRRHAIWSLLVFLLVSVAVLGVRPMVQPDEARYGIIAAEMVQTGEWFSLRLAGFHYYEKPPVGYWLMALSIQTFGENAFAIRLPSALATGIAAIAGWMLAVRISGRRELGPLAFAVQATTIGPLVMGTVANLDAMFSAAVGVCLVSFYLGCTSTGRSRFGWLAVAGVAAGVGFLTKGLLALAIPGATAIAWLCWERRWRDLIVLPWIPILAAIAVTAPVAILLHQSEPRFWEYFLVVEHLRRFSNPDINQHTAPWWYLIVLLPVGAVLWSLTWPRAWRGLRCSGSVEWRSGCRYCIAWVVAPLLLLSCSAGKLPTYVLPLFVPVSVLVTLGLVRAFDQNLAVSTRSRCSGRWILLGLAAGAVVLAITGTAWIGFPLIWRTNPALHWIALACALVVWALLGAWSWRATSRASWLMRTATAPVLVLALIPFLFPDGIAQRSQIPWEVLRTREVALTECGVLVSSSQLAYGVSWVTGRRDLLIAGRASEFDNELALPQDDARLVAIDDVAGRVRAAPTGGLALVTSPEDAQEVIESPEIPAPFIHDVQGNMAVVIWK